MNNAVKEIPFRKELTVKALSKAEEGKYFFQKSDIATIFPMNGKFTVIITGLFDGENLPMLDEVRMAHLLNMLGKTGWKKCQFIQK
ncbi:hypothetical protein COF68_14155 [Bacillus toyonensis]|uniref:hypothetical protein n=1 Tax=Bacillus cereus group TaxID=86661 RepID=UPI000B4B7D74|nr:MULTISPECIES: hypothetical protein [Bacillus cereus group]PFW92700.1 hypothetical protein COL33_14285 [Bacillus toyonensis]PFY77931.1 hypothetical protein COL46_01585 [Bacillus toyonensis]PGE93959.1 hypothetical protein COM75_00855 [Bacillus toyonensis]PHA93284.1 hypothetical protein COE77_01640 [Bacillus toyonensis]PHC58353.1 hypothetical protein COF34_15785 [Bacillus toyonensis]